MSCFGFDAPDWKREVVQDYKWDYVDVREFRKTNFTTRAKYTLIYVCILRDLAIIGLDIFTCVTMLSSDTWKSAAFAACKQDEDGTEQNNCNKIKFQIARWVFVGCIFFSFLLYLYEFYKARQVVLSRDISYSYTNIMANDYYSLKSYNNFCLYCELGASRSNKKDKIAFFVFFTFKNWKRVILADGPRQCINALMLYYVAEGLHFTTNWDELSKYWDNSVVTLLLLLAMLTTIVLFLISFIQLVIALFLYPFVLSYIKGNLKEYVCHKVDKRMGEVMRRMQKRRFNEAIELEKKVAAGETIMNSRGEVVDASLLQPTLPKIDLSDHPGPSRPSDRLLGRPMSPAMGGPMSPAMGRPMSPAVGRPMSPAMGGPNSAAALRSASPAPTPDVYVSNWTPQPPASISHETTEMEIYDAYSDSPSDDDHSSYYHGVTSGTGSALGHSSNLGHGSNHGHGYGHSSHHGHGHHPFPRQRDYDSTQVGLLSGAAPMGHSAPMRMYPTTPAPAGAPGYPPPNPLTAGAPSFPPSHSSPAPSVASLAPSLAPPSRVLVPSSGRAGTAPNAPLQRSGLQYNVNAHGW